MLFTDSNLLAFCWLPRLIDLNLVPDLFVDWPEALRKQYKLTSPWNAHTAEVYNFFQGLTPHILSRCSSYVQSSSDWAQCYTFLFSIHFSSIPTISSVIHDHTLKLYNYLLPIWSQLQQECIVGRSWTLKVKQIALTCTTDLYYAGTLVGIESIFHLTKRREQVIMKLLLQATIIRQLGHVVNYIGVLLPMQCAIHFFDITNWSEVSLFKLITQAAQFKHGYFDSHSQWQRLTPPTGWSNIGNIMGFGYNNLTSAQDIIQQISHYRKDSFKPVQIMLGDLTNKNVQHEYSSYFTNGGPVFVHGSLDINLVRPSSIKRCLSELTNALAVNARGVVFHVGKSAKADDINVMISSLNSILCSMTSVSCPLLLETPAGQGKELASKTEQFIYVLDKLYDHILNGTLKVCLDTCHVLAAGYDPSQYLDILITRYGPSIIGLIHFNDSKTCCGSGVDRHFLPGYGFVGFPALYQVVERCHKYNWPAVVEVNLVHNMD